MKGIVTKGGNTSLGFGDGQGVGEGLSGNKQQNKLKYKRTRLNYNESTTMVNQITESVNNSIKQSRVQRERNNYIQKESLKENYRGLIVVSKNQNSTAMQTLNS